MICYRDRTFCSSPHCKDECGRKLTDEVIEGARKWWEQVTKGKEKDGGPIASMYFCDENGKCIG